MRAESFIEKYCSYHFSLLLLSPIGQNNLEGIWHHSKTNELSRCLLFSLKVVFFCHDCSQDDRSIRWLIFTAMKHSNFISCRKISLHFIGCIRSIGWTQETIFVWIHTTCWITFFVVGEKVLISRAIWIKNLHKFYVSSFEFTTFDFCLWSITMNPVHIRCRRKSQKLQIADDYTQYKRALVNRYKNGSVYAPISTAVNC